MENNISLPLHTARKFKFCPMCGKKYPICDDGDYRVRLWCTGCEEWDEDLLLIDEYVRRYGNDN